MARSAAEIEELRESWTAWQDHPNSVIDDYLSRFSGEATDSRPYVMVVYRAGRPDCLLIGKEITRQANSRSSRLLRSSRRVLYFIEGGLLGSRSIENCRFLVRGIITRLRRGEADAAEFCGLPLNSSLYCAARAVPGFFSRDHFPLRLVHRYLLLPNNFQEFLRALPTKERENINYRERRLLKSFPGSARFRRFCGTEDVESLIKDAEEVARKAYQRALGRGFTLGEAACVRAQAHNGSLRGYVLYIEEKPCAFLIAAWQKGVLYGTFVGHDPEYAQYAPGRFLLMRCIEDCFNGKGGERTVLLDPGVGDQPYKRLFTNMERHEAHVTIHSPTFRGFLANLVRSGRHFGAHSAKRVLAKARLLTLVQKIHRKHAVRKWRASQSGSAVGLSHDQME